MSAVRLLTALVVATAILVGYRAEVPADKAAPPTGLVRVERVVDGDTLVVDVQGQRERVRVLGIDAPEVGRDGHPGCGALEATQRLRALVEHRDVALVGR